MQYIGLYHIYDASTAAVFCTFLVLTLAPLGKKEAASECLRMLLMLLCMPFCH